MFPTAPGSAEQRGQRLLRTGAIVAMTVGLTGIVLAGVALAIADAGPGTGNGVVGSVFALAIGLIGVVLGGLARARSRRTDLPPDRPQRRIRREMSVRLCRAALNGQRLLSKARVTGAPWVQQWHGEYDDEGATYRPTNWRPGTRTSSASTRSVPRILRSAPGTEDTWSQGCGEAVHAGRGVAATRSVGQRQELPHREFRRASRSPVS
ncbi:DUF6223 family protein [Streptomyces hirsutus]|uniref:DUF6223 family protein n=1 Tax=Streptomyces hirsutus TaxID=35620 RepID=UPI0036458286